MRASKALDKKEKLRIHDSDKVIIIHSEESEWAKRLAEGLKRELGLE
jgi:RNA polymerase subunit RPABC4/transcription elongation factor Spt4